MNPNRRLWFVLLLFIAAVLLPTACLLWLINDSIAKQRQIARQQLADAYRSHLKLVSDRLEDYWRKQSAAPPKTNWDAAVRAGIADTFVFYNREGRMLYPAPPAVPITTPDASVAWAKARQLEEQSEQVHIFTAAEAYARIAATSADPNEIARAIQAQARCLRQAGKVTAVVSLILDRFTSPRLQSVPDAQGRIIAADALLMAIQLMPASDPRRQRAATRLHAWLTDYAIAMPSAQRLFLMKEVSAMNLNLAFPSLEAEQLAAQAIEAGAARSLDDTLRPSGLKNTWMLGSKTGEVTAILRAETIQRHIQSFLSTQSFPPHVRIALTRDTHDAIDTIAAGTYLPEWRIALFSTNPQAFDELNARQLGIYIWSGALVLIAVCCIAFVAGRSMHRHMRLANLKSDLVATVSHELKTPLASIRLLLDTLLQQEHPDPRQTREYLELMDRESTRLTQMIENFLAFSRLERNRYNFRFSQTHPGEIVERAAGAFSDRAAEPQVSLNVHIDPDLPSIHADPAALSTVLVNLLDNAYKYTPEQKRIELRAFRNNGNVCFEVEDNGIGVSAPEASKVFRDFYQVDNRLARSQGGCGLGLSIVKFIIKAHKGTVSLDSRVGHGSTFKVSVPCEPV